MTLSKLSLRNAKRQANDYLIFFVTIVMVCAMLYAFNSLAFSEEILKLSSMMSSLTLVIVLSSIVVVFIIGWLVSYITSFMLSRRSRELGTYLLIGLENKQVARLFFLENSLVGGISLLFGIPLGNIVFQLLRAILLTMFSAPYHFHYHFSLKAIGLTLAYFVVIYFFALKRSQKRIQKAQIYDLIYFERQNETELVKKKKTRTILFVVSVFFGVIGTLLMLAGELILGILGASCIIVFIYGFFTSFSSGVPAYFERKPKRKYQGQNLIIFRTLTAKLSTMGMTMATVALLFTATLLTEGAGMVFNGIYQGRLERNSFDLLFVSDQESHVAQFQENMEEHTPVVAFWQYKLYPGTNDSLMDYLEETAGYYRYSYDHDYNENAMIAYSDYAALRKMLGLSEAKLEQDHYLIHCMPYLKDAMSQWNQPLNLDGNSLLPSNIYTEQFSQNLWNGNGHQFLLVVPDEFCTGHPAIRYALAAMTIDPITSQQFELLDIITENKNKQIDAVHMATNEWDLFYSKCMALNDTAIYSSITIFPLFYLALTLAMTAATVLTVQQLSEAGRYCRQFELLRKLGMDQQEMRSVLFRQFAIYYLMPAIPPILIAIPFILDMCNAVEPGTMVGASSPWIILTISLGLFFLVYLVYTVIAYISMKRNVLPE